MRSSSPLQDIRHAAIQDWLDAFAAAIREEDYARGRELFADDVAEFGTRTAIMTGIDKLMATQWKPIWSTTAGFQFQLDQLQFGVDGELAWVALPWTSRFRQPPANGARAERRGRATYVLRLQNGRWLAIHSHHSIDP
jgi:ketosteroid isomerase-like protein